MLANHSGTYQLPRSDEPNRHISVGALDRIWMVLMLVHIPLGYFLITSPTLAVLHAWFVLLNVAGAIVTRRWTLSLFVLAYIVSAEPLWRILELSPLVPYEIAKYVLISVSFLGIVQRYRRLQELPSLPFLYLLCLLPSAILLLGLDFTVLRRVAGSLLGPVALGLFAIYMHTFSLNRQSMTRIAVMAICPVIVMAVWATNNMMLAMASGELYFGASSNRIVGGIGPNQVSNTLAFGGVFCWLLFLEEKRWSTKLILLLILLSLATIAILTFSRGGVFALLGAIGITLIAGTPRNLISPKRYIFLFAVVAVFFLVIWPFVDSLTSGRAANRFSNLDTSGRGEIAMVELEEWFENPVLGTGPGMGRSGLGETSSHTEFTRLLAEHGMFGAIAVVFLFSGIVKNFQRAKSGISRSWVAAVGLFFVAYSVQAATRTAAPAFLYGIIWAELFSEDFAPIRANLGPKE